MKRVNVSVNLGVMFAIINYVEIKINADVNALQIIWNPSNCECECDKSCDVGEYLDYENCKCRKKLVDKLVGECTETVEEVKLAKITLSENENSIIVVLAQFILYYFGYFLQLMLVE